MIDMHSHIVFEVDDGSSSKEESLNIIRIANERGIKAMFATSHYIEGSMTPESNEIKEKLDILRNKLEAENIFMPLYCGHEIFLDYESLNHLKSGKSLSLNESRYVLIEMPMQTKMNNLDDVLFQFTLAGYTPVIAHPERYSYVQKDLDLVKRWIELGALMQLNLSALIGRYGDVVKKTSMKMLDRNMYHLVGSDVHSSRSSALSIAAPLGRIKELVSPEMYYDIIEENPKKIIENRIIIPFDIKSGKLSILERIKRSIG